MGIIINQSIKNSAISYVGIILGFIATIKLFPNILTIDQFGLTRVMISITTLSVQFLNFGIPKSIIKFSPKLRDLTTKPSSIYWAFIIPPLIAFIAFIIIFLGLEFKILEWYQADSILLSNYYIFIIPLVFFTSSFGLLNSFLKSNFDTVFASFLQDVFLRIVTIINLLFYSANLIDFEIFIIIFVANYALQYILLFIYAVSKDLIKFQFDYSLFTPSSFVEIFKYSFYAFFSGLTILIIGNIDLLMIGVFEGLSLTGVYAVAIYVGAVILAPKKSLAKISFPIISNFFKDNDIKLIKDIYKKTSLNQYIAGLLIYIGVLANINNLFAILPEEYVAGAIVIVIIGLGNLFDMITGANGQIIISSPNYRFDFYSSLIIIVIAIISNYILIPKFSIVGAAIATTFSILSGNIIRVYYVWFKFKIQPFSWELIGVTILGISLYFISIQINELTNIYLDIVLRSISILTLYLGGVWVFNLSEDVKSILELSFKRLFKH